MNIYIMRHGKPDTPAMPHKVSSAAFQDCLAIYNCCGIRDTSRPTRETVSLFSDFDAIVSSDLTRSLDSASLLRPQSKLIIDPMFREIESTFISIPFLTLTPKMWGTLFILLWFCGVLNYKNDFIQGKKRAKQCAQKLACLAAEHQNVLFVGHGFINTYISKALRKLGWTGPRIPSKNYWDYAVYHKNGT